MKKLIYKLIKKVGYSVHKIDQNKKAAFMDIQEPEFWEIYEACKPFTMTSVERMYALYASVNYILSNDVKGAFVECGVWRGGSAMLIAKMMVNRGILSRKIYLYDTFEGMVSPTAEDVNINGLDASLILKNNKHDKKDPAWCVAGLADVQKNMRSTRFPEENIIYVKGKVEDTLPGTIPPEQIALLRLDTDWYESTKHEMQYLFPKLGFNSVIIIDDYGHWEGCKKAVDDYLAEQKINILLNRVDYTCRVGIKVTS